MITLSTRRAMLVSAVIIKTASAGCGPATPDAPVADYGNTCDNAEQSCFLWYVDPWTDAQGYKDQLVT